MNCFSEFLLSFNGNVPRFVVAMLIAIVMFAAESTAADTGGASPPPNVVLIMADDLGYQELGCYGQKWIRTPFVDQLAAEGIKLTQFYSGNAVCAPSRCCLMTGKHPGHAWVRNNGDPKLPEELREKYQWEFAGQFPLPESEVTVAELLKQKGYATAAIGKWGLGHFGTTGAPDRQGIDLFYGFNSQRHAHNHYPRFLWRNDQKEIQPGNDRTLNGETYSQDRFTEVALEFIDQNKDQPFFLYLPFAIPHLSIQVPESTLAEYTDEIPEEEYKHRGYLKHPKPRAGYAAMITHMDRDIGKIMARLNEYGLTDNTLIIFTSDNGPTYDRLGGSDSDFFESAGKMRGLKGSLYEGGIRVPCVARWPGQIPAGNTSDLISALWDLFPTIAEAAGVEPHEEIDGISLLPEFTGKTEEQPRHDYLYWEFPAYGGQQAVRMGRWKGIRQGLSRKNPDLSIELYDLETDISESNNVAEEHPETVAKIREIMQQAHTPSEAFPFPAID
ncbi:MAG: arylsulfatase [Rubinisphaera brasiliensis]|uniref:arylsulfatase n=1 Tax=Rubinisphaera brasiliensis TaxID=119 RepID=UPI00391B648B